MLTIIEGIVLCVVGFAFGTYYMDLSKENEIRWEYEPLECINPKVCDIARVNISIYKLGGETTKDARLLFAVADPKVCTVVGGSVQRSNVSLFEKIVSRKEQAHGAVAALPSGDPELNESTAFDYTVNELEPGYRYELTVILKGKGANAFKSHFQIVDKMDHSVGHEHLTTQNYITLYLVEVLVVSIISFVVLAILVFGLTWKGRRFLAPVARVFRRMR
ncbi:MAG TPA: hypothetical protein VLB46_09930 [Pyrinomonadaceae bacterium]|nr:hypothetical protein [Pyrinomonadaceae bacterium]